MPKKKDKVYTQADHIDFVNHYLDTGNGRGRLQSAATIYDGKVGYFFVSPIRVGGVVTDSILFSCMPHDDIVITSFPTAKEPAPRKETPPPKAKDDQG
ncbi:hypothetical protein D9M68_294760 [compost metagenome]